MNIIAIRRSVVLLSAIFLAAPLAHATGMGADDARYLLTRTGFAPDPAEIAEFAALTREQAVDRILSGTRTQPVTAYPDDLNNFIAGKQIRTMSRQQRRELIRTQLREGGTELRAWWLGEMLHTPSPLTERMTLFWHNHFVSSQQKVRSPKLMLNQNLLLREDAVGNFGKMLHAVSKDPAMVIYLDSASNRKGQPNENFAREVMELFTLGEGHYTEDDIKQAARAFTGWSIDRDTGQFVFRRKVHDGGIKTVFGKSGDFDGDDVLDLLLARRETSEFIVGKLWREFVSPQPDAPAVQKIAATFRDQNYEIKPVLRQLFLSDAFWAPETRGAIVKSPVDVVVGSLRSLDADVPDAMPFVRTLKQLGQDIFAPPNVKGWPGGDTWINTATLLERKQYLDRIARADDATRQMAAQRIGDAMSARAAAIANGSTSAPISGEESKDMMANAKRMEAAIRNMDIDIPAWTQSVDHAGFTAETALLAVAPVEKNDVVAGNNKVRALLLDPSYEVK
ncbi:MAG TPA: DUF1800 domain-containing protein [Rhodocyclaceae bacterium]|nr:DUF1800 domain-containing protein [Rhodocyclaceae bacterium]